MSEADYPNRPLQQTYSPISKYGQISIAEQLARLEEIRNGGRRPAYRPQVPSQESQWGQIQEGFSQVESELSWQLRQDSLAAERQTQRRLSPDQDGRSWVQEYREKQRMRKVAQEARERAEADLQRLLKEREEAQARAQEQERLAAEAAERLRKLEDAEQEALRAAAREQQRREQQVLNTQVAEEKSEAEKMAELLASFQNLQAAAQQPASAPATPDVSAPRATEAVPTELQQVPQVPVQAPPRDSQTAPHPRAIPQVPVQAAPRDSQTAPHPRAVPQEPTAPPTSAPRREAPRQAPTVAAKTQAGVTSAPVEPEEHLSPTPSRIFADVPGGAGKPVYSPPNVGEGFSAPAPEAEPALDADITQPVKVSPIDLLADEADDRALADSLAFAAGSKKLSSTRPASVVPASRPTTTAPTSLTPDVAHAAGQVGTVQPQVASPVAPAPQIQSAPAATTSTHATPQTSARVSALDSANLSPLNLSVGEAGSAAELFQQALAQTKLETARGVAATSQAAEPAVGTASPGSARPAPAPPVSFSGQRQATAAPAVAPQAQAPVQPTQVAPPPSVQPVSPARSIPAQVNVAAPQPALAQPVETPAAVTPSQPAAGTAPAAPLAQPAASSEGKPIEAPSAYAESAPPQEEKTRWWQWKRQTKKAEAPEQEDPRAGAWQESAEDEGEGEEEPLTFIQTFLRWVLRLSILLIIALGMVLTMDRPVISQTMGQDFLQPGIVDDVSVTQI